MGRHHVSKMRNEARYIRYGPPLCNELSGRELESCDAIKKDPLSDLSHLGEKYLSFRSRMCHKLLTVCDMGDDDVDLR